MCVAAVDAMVRMAGTIGETDDAKRYEAELAQWRTAYDHRFWNASTGTYTGDAFEVQTLTSITLGAAAASTEHRASAIHALTTDIESRDHHLTVGSAGQKWLFRELTAVGKHDTALALALQTTYPSFGYWIANGATTCWVSFSRHWSICFAVNTVVRKTGPAFLTSRILGSPQHQIRPPIITYVLTS
jgi:alpha-L-rhamnosidase